MESGLIVRTAIFLSRSGRCFNDFMSVCISGMISRNKQKPTAPTVDTNALASLKMRVSSQQYINIKKDASVADPLSNKL